MSGWRSGWGPCAELPTPLANQELGWGLIEREQGTYSVSSRGVAKELAKWERKMLGGAFRRCGVITAIAFSAAMLISDARFNVAEAQGKPRAEDLACGKELQELCSGKATLVGGLEWKGTKIPNCLAQE